MSVDTPAQLRALEVFRLMASLPQGDHFVRASAVAACLREEGVVVQNGQFRQLKMEGDDILDVEVLEIEGAFVDAQGVHHGWGNLARAYGSSPDKFLPEPPKFFSLDDESWLGPRGAILTARAIKVLRAHLQHQALDAGTQASTARPSPRL